VIGTPEICVGYMWSIAMSVSFPFQHADAQSLHHLPHGTLDQNKTPCAATKKNCRIRLCVIYSSGSFNNLLQFFRHGRVVVVQFQYGL
jgi:hypothetical protein